MGIFGKKRNSPKLVFIVEDNTMYAKSLEFFLRSGSEALEVKIFPVGELCLEQLHLHPDLVIMDYFLNSRFHDAVDGLAILKEIKSRTPKMPVIVLSSQQDVAVAQAVKGTGSEYLMKDEKAFENIRHLMS